MLKATILILLAAVALLTGSGIATAAPPVSTVTQVVVEPVAMPPGDTMELRAGVGAGIGAVLGGLAGLPFFIVGAIPGALIGAALGAGIGAAGWAIGNAYAGG